MRSFSCAALLIGSWLASACALDDGDAADDDFVGNSEILDAASEYRDTMSQINLETILSTHTGEPQVNVWISSTGEAEFRSLDPSVSQPELEFPTATMIVKEMLDPEGEIAMYAIMYKQPAGYAPDYGDWWWAIVDPNFEVVDDLVGNGTTVAFCRECHAAPATHAASDFAIGIDAANQQP